MTRSVNKPDEGGYTVVEVMIASAILLVVIAILAPLLTGTLTTFVRQADRTGGIDGAGLILQQIERDVMAASILNVVSPGNDLQLINGQAGNATCIEYQVPPRSAPQPLALQRRSRAAGSAVAWPAGGGWQTMLTALRIAGQPAGTVIPNPAGANPFAGAGNGRSVVVDLQVQNGSSPVNELKTTATGRTVIGGLSGTATWAAQCA